MTAVRAQHRNNLIIGWAWFTFGMFGLADDLLGWGIGVDKSIPVLFFISVYANFISHLAASAANRAEVANNEEST